MADFNITNHAGDFFATEDADTVAGSVPSFSGWIGDISLLGGDDLARLNRETEVDSVFETVSEWIAYQGHLDGGSGADTLSVGIVCDIVLSRERTDLSFTFEYAMVTGFETLETRWMTTISVAQLAQFNSIRGGVQDVNQTDDVWLELYGAGGLLDMATLSTSAEFHQVDASKMTSGLRYYGTTEPITFATPPMPMICAAPGATIISSTQRVPIFFRAVSAPTSWKCGGPRPGHSFLFLSSARPSLQTEHDSRTSRVSMFGAVTQTTRFTAAS